MLEQEWDVALDALEQIRNDLRSAVVGYGLRREYPVPEQEHPGVDHGNSAHLHPGRPYLHVQRDLICQPLPACGQFGGLRRRGDSRTGHQATVWSAMRPNVYFSQGLSPKWSKDIRAKGTTWHGGYEVQDVQQHQHPPVVPTRNSGVEHARPRTAATTTKVFRYAERC